MSRTRRVKSVSPIRSGQCKYAGLAADCENQASIQRICIDGTREAFCSYHWRYARYHPSDAEPTGTNDDNLSQDFVNAARKYIGNESTAEFIDAQLRSAVLKEPTR